MASPTPDGDELAEQLHAKITEFRKRQHLLTIGGPEAAQILCDHAFSAVTKNAVGRIPQGNDAELSSAIHSHWMDPIGAMLSEAFYELRLVSHELALEVARRRRAMGSIGGDEAAWLELMEWEPEPPEWLDEEQPALEELPPAPLGQIALGGYEPAEAEAFLQMLGRDLQGAWFRTFHARRDGFPHPRGGADLHGFTLPNQLTLHSENADGLGIYMVVGNAETASGFNKTIGKPTGAVIDADITSCPALFTEWDDKPKEWQITAWQELGLPEPSFQIDTGGKSIHSYWVFHQPISPAQWRELQLRLIAHGGGDSKLRNPSRVMRVPGFRYLDKATGALGERTRIITSSGRRYGLNELQACLPELTESQEPVSNLQPALQGPPASQTCDLPPRPLEQVRAALQHIPPRIPGSGTYQDDRPAAIGYIHAVQEAGGSQEQAIDDLRAHHPAWTDIDQVIRSSDLTAFSAGSFWHAVKANGGTTARPDLKGKRQEVPGDVTFNGHRPTPPPQRVELPTTPEAKLADLQAFAAELLERREQFSSRLPIMRARAQELSLHIRDTELQGLLTSARRRRIHGNSEHLLGPGDVLDLTPEPWAWEGLILRGCLNLLVALPKQGKTALVLAMVAAWHRNNPALLGCNLLGPCPPVMIVGTDQGQSDWGRMLQGAGLVDAQGRIGGPIVGLAHAGRPLHLDPEGIDRIAEHAQQHPGLLVVIDSLSACIAPLGLKEESPEIAEPVADLMEQLEPHGATVVLIHHASKGRAGEGATSASRGSTALPAHASQILKLGPASNNPQDHRRMLTTEGRCGLPQTLVIERDGATWRLLGGAEVLEQERETAGVVAKLTDDQYGALQFVCDRWEDDHERTTTVDLVAGLGGSGKDPERVVRKQLQGLEKKGLLQSNGTPRPGRGGRLYAYWPTDQGVAASRARTPEQRSDGSDGSDESLACEDPELDQSLLSLVLQPTDPTDPTDHRTGEPRV